MMTSKRFVVALLGSFLATSAAAQQGQQPPTTVAAYVRNAYMGNKNNILRSAEKMPEEYYGLRPGPQEEVRTFGQHLAHVANYNFLWCSQAKGEEHRASVLGTPPGTASAAVVDVIGARRSP